MPWKRRADEPVHECAWTWMSGYNSALGDVAGPVKEVLHARVFWAIPFSADEHGMLKSLQESLATMPALDDFRWARPENIHITLRFLGDIEGAQSEAAAEALRRAGAGASAFDIPIDSLWRFPRISSARACSGRGPSKTPEPLAELEANLSRYLAETGFSF